jgi:hypothetical protein
LIYSYINTSANWENEKLCGKNFSHNFEFSQFPRVSTRKQCLYVYQHGNSLYLFYNIAQRNIKKEIFRRFRVDIELYQHGS